MYLSEVEGSQTKWGYGTSKQNPVGLISIEGEFLKSNNTKTTWINYLFMSNCGSKKTKMKKKKLNEKKKTFVIEWFHLVNC